MKKPKIKFMMNYIAVDDSTYELQNRIEMEMLMEEQLSWIHDSYKVKDIIDRLIAEPNGVVCIRHKRFWVEVS